mmetsp:Transcript_46781/g.124278  ORF Transcript_46781/g.124278 Transcript_46781/m.124278 type:complete len:308 (+) Transcript_46781:177-1100(+)
MFLCLFVCVCARARVRTHARRLDVGRQQHLGAEDDLGIAREGRYEPRRRQCPTVQLRLAGGQLGRLRVGGGRRRRLERRARGVRGQRDGEVHVGRRPVRREVGAHAQDVVEAPGSGLEEGVDQDRGAVGGADAVREKRELAVGREEGEDGAARGLVPPNALVHQAVVEGQARLPPRGVAADDGAEAQREHREVVVEREPHLWAARDEGAEHHRAVDVALRHLARPVEHQGEPLHHVDKHLALAPRVARHGDGLVGRRRRHRLALPEPRQRHLLQRARHFLLHPQRVGHLVHAAHKFAQADAADDSSR